MADCIEKLRGMLDEVSRPPKKRTATKPTRGARERRLSEKREKSEKKKRRGRVRGED